jgi:hypothetical protein
MKEENKWYMGFDPVTDKVRILSTDTGVRGIVYGYEALFEFERKERLLAMAISNIKIEIGL